MSAAFRAPLAVDPVAGTLKIDLTVAAAASSRPLRVLVDTGSAQTWLPAEHLRLSGAAGSCVPTGGNFSQRYSDGSRVRGVLCTTELQIGGHRWRQVVGAATELTDGLDAARGGVLALSPAPESSFDPLLAALPPGNRRLSLCARTGWLAVGGGCDAAASPAAAADVPMMMRLASSRHWKLAVSGPRLALLDDAPPGWARRRGRGYTRAPPLRLRGETAAAATSTTHEAQIDSGTTHIAVAAALHDQLLAAVGGRASLALTLHDGNATAITTGTSRSAVAVRRRPSLPVTVEDVGEPPLPPLPLLVPISHDCAPSMMAASASASLGRAGCLRRSIAPVLRPPAPGGAGQWLLGVPFLLHYDVAFDAQRRCGLAAAQGPPIHMYATVATVPGNLSAKLLDSL